MSGVPVTTELSLSAWIRLLLGSLGVGLIVSAARWLLIDTLYHCTGLTAPCFDFGRLRDQLDVFLVAVEHNYRFYQWYSNLFISILLVVAIHFVQPATPWSWPIYIGIAGLELLLIVASRDCLRRYYLRLTQLVGESTPKVPTVDR